MKMKIKLYSAFGNEVKQFELFFILLFSGTV